MHPEPLPPADAYERKKTRMAAQMRDYAGTGGLALGKKTSNLFRARPDSARRLAAGDLNAVLAVNPAEGWVEAEGMTTYAALVEKLLPIGCMPAVVPQLKTITLGGAVSGLGIEATSFRQGLVHETVLDMEVLLADGTVVHCAPEGEHRDLFFGIPNSYGTLGYILKLRARVIPAQPFVCVEHRRFTAAADFFRALEGACASAADFVEGVVFAQHDLVLSTASFTRNARRVSDYTGRRIYYRSLRERATDTLTTAGWLWRWDTDWFWGSRHFGLENPLLRALAGRRFLNSATYTRLMRLDARWGITRGLDKLRGLHAESVVQDILIPIDHCAEFLAFLLREVGITPVWICPTRPPDPAAACALVPVAPMRLGVDFGFWDTRRTRTARPPGHLNRLIEQKAAELRGFKSLYSEAYYPREEFHALYGGTAYARLKARYDPAGRLPGLYEKCVPARQPQLPGAG